MIRGESRPWHPGSRIRLAPGPAETIAGLASDPIRSARTPNERQGYRNGAARCPLVGSIDAIDVARRALLRAPRRTPQRPAVPDATPTDPGPSPRRARDGG